MGQDRRRYPRVDIALEFTGRTGGVEWRGKTLDLSPAGAKVEPPQAAVALAVGSRIELALTLRPGEPPLSLAARVVRMDPGGIGLSFVDLGALEFARLKMLVDSLLQAEANAPLSLEVDLRRLKDRRRAPRAEGALEISLAAETPRFWEGVYRMVDLSVFGVSLAWPARLGQPGWGTPVQISLAGGNARPPLFLAGLVWRRDPERVAILFVDLTPEQRGRLRELVHSLRAVPGAPVGVCPVLTESFSP